MKPTFTVLMAGIFFAVNLSAADCDTMCKVPGAQDLDNDHVIIDASTGDVIGGRTRFPQVAGVQIVFVNKNPFKYTYRFNIQTKLLDEGIIADGLQLLGFSLPSGSGAVIPPPTLDCEGVDASDFESALQNAGAAETSLRNVLEPYAARAKSHDDFVTLTNDDKIVCEDVCPKAQALLPELEAMIADAPRLEAALTALSEALDTVRTTRTALETAIGNDVAQANRQDCLDNVEALARPAGLINAKVQEYNDAIKTAKAVHGDVVKLRNILRDLSPTSFTEKRLATTTGPSEVTVDIMRRQLRVDNAQEAQLGDTIKIIVGESRFSMSGGVGWSTLDSARIIRSRAPDPADATKTIEVFGEENNSELDPQIVALLNARIGPSFRLFKRASLPASFAWSTGLVVATASSTDTVGTAYLTGPSFLLNDNAFVVSFLVHSARVGRLARGFELGKPIPAELQDPLPLDNDRELGVMLAITYRTR